jgi:hypothetical protein
MVPGATTSKIITPRPPNPLKTNNLQKKIAESKKKTEFFPSSTPVLDGSTNTCSAFSAPVTSVMSA